MLNCALIMVIVHEFHTLRWANNQCNIMLHRLLRCLKCWPLFLFCFLFLFSHNGVHHLRLSPPPSPGVCFVFPVPSSKSSLCHSWRQRSRGSESFLLLPVDLFSPKFPLLKSAFPPCSSMKNTSGRLIPPCLHPLAPSGERKHTDTHTPQIFTQPTNCNYCNYIIIVPTTLWVWCLLMFSLIWHKCTLNTDQQKHTLLI